MPRAKLAYVAGERVEAAVVGGALKVAQDVGHPGRELILPRRTALVHWVCHEDQVSGIRSLAPR
jgi:hypothetical protein